MIVAVLTVTEDEEDGSPRVFADAGFAREAVEEEVSRAYDWYVAPKEWEERAYRDLDGQGSWRAVWTFHLPLDAGYWHPSPSHGAPRHSGPCRTYTITEAEVENA